MCLPGKYNTIFLIINEWWCRPLLGQYCNITIITQYQGMQICHYNGMDIIVAIITITQVRNNRRCQYSYRHITHTRARTHTHTHTHAYEHTHTHTYHPPTHEHTHIPR